MKFLSQIWFIVRSEVSFLARYRRLLLSASVVVFVPAMYAVVYLTSVWDPEAKTGALPVALVNLDEGVHYKEHVFNVGWEIVTRLQDSERFGFAIYNSEETARKMVREGKLAFAVIIPRDFSANAVPGSEAGAGKVVVYTSEGNNFESAAIAKHFAEILGREINENLNERRWALVLRNASGSQRSVESLRDAVGQLRTGAQDLSKGLAQTHTGVQTLASGAARLNHGVDQLTSGVKQLSAGLKTMDARRPRNSDLTRIAAGAQALSDGHEEMDKGLDELQKGSRQLHKGVIAFRDDAKDSFFVSSSSLENINKFADGVTQLKTGLENANTAHDKLADGASRLNTGVTALTTGVRAMNAGIGTMLTKLPEDSQLNELSRGSDDVESGAIALLDATGKVHQGAQRLSSGIDLLASSLPNSVDTIDGSAQGLANSVRTLVEVDAPVANSGSGFASNVIPGALWLGAGVAAFLIHVRVLPRHAQFFSRPAKVLGKVFLPLCVALLQSLVIFLTVLYFLKIHIDSPWAFMLTLSVAALTFVFIVFALAKALGDAGKGIAMFLLAIQLSSSGGIVPLELSGGLFAQISPWLPLTWVVRGIKASMFGAYGGAWQQPVLLVALAGVSAAAIACMVGRWRYIKATNLRSTVDF